MSQYTFFEVVQKVSTVTAALMVLVSGVNLLTNSDIHNYNTSNKDTLRLPRVTRNWGKQRVCHHSLKEWNKLEKEARNAPNIATFKRNVFA